MKSFAPLLSALLLLVPSATTAAIGPASQDELIDASHHVVTGRVLSVESKVQKSTIEKGIGNQDEIFTIKLKVEQVTVGKTIKVGDEITVMAWKPHRRIGAAVFSGQGHDTIPAKGDRATFYLSKGYLDKPAGAYEPYMPNGIEIKEVPESED